MKTKILIAVLTVTGLAIAGYAFTNEKSMTKPAEACATCVGAKPCKACKNCKYCKHCKKDGGTCGVCK